MDGCPHVQPTGCCTLVPPSGGVLNSSENIPRAERKDNGRAKGYAEPRPAEQKFVDFFGELRLAELTDQTAKSLVEGLSFG